MDLLQQISGKSSSEAIRLIDLYNAQKKVELTENHYKKIEKKRKIRVPKPTIFMFKPFTISERGDTQARCGVDRLDKVYKHLLYNLYDVEKMLQNPSMYITIDQTITKEVYYFRNKKRASRFLVWLKAKHPEKVLGVRKHLTIGRKALAEVKKNLLDKWVDINIKGFKIYRKKFYKPAERVIVKSGLFGRAVRV